MSIVQQGQVNLAAAQRPGTIVVIVPPAVTPILGVPSNVLGVVGTASWGPVNSPTVVGNYPEYVRKFGQLNNRTYDMGTQVAVATQLGANDLLCVRMTDGTDTAALCDFGKVSSNFAVSLTSVYTGTLGNQTVATLGTGTKASSWKLTVQLPGFAPEVFDNITGAAATFWNNLVSAVNNGNSALRGKSNLVTATLGTLTTTAVAAGTTAGGGSGSLTAMAGGTDGVTTITSTVLVGTNGTTGPASRTGMYALTNTPCRILNIADCTDPTQWGTINSWALLEGVYPIVAGPAGDTLSGAATYMGTAGMDTFEMKVLFGDYCYWNDTVSGLVRLVSPAAFAAGMLGNLSPNLALLNQRIPNITGTQSRALHQVYSDADILALMAIGVDVITNPSPGGNYYACATGRNTSSNPGINGDNYSTMTNFLAPTLSQSMGFAIGQLQSLDQRLDVIASLDNFMLGLWEQGLIGNAQGVYPNGPQPWSIELDDSNNTPTQVALGQENVALQVQYLSVVANLVVSLEAGQNVTITHAAA